jgi:methylated-DNA-[protein]-cysteine S-methyltransferase
MNAIAMPVLEMGDSAVSVTRVDSPLGALHVAAVATGVCAMVFDDHRDALTLRLRRMLGPFFRIQPGDPLGVGPTLHAYFAGALDALADIPLATVATPMQRRVWSLVSAVPAGSVTTYAALAERLGMPRAQRAVGVCLATNAVPIFVPCHRVVSTSGALASHPGGIERKRWLLRHERALDVADLTMARVLRARRRARLDLGDTVELVEWSRVVGY